MTALAFLSVACGGGLGALCRGLMTRFLKRHTPSDWPFATLIVNLIACGIAGFLMPIQLGDIAHLAVIIGFLGGFSTLATMNYEAASLFRDKRYLACLLYLLVTYASTLGSAAIGCALAGAIMV
ncbi:MAG: fluoride efflux transporter FluC [Eggerthellaceae bacterium]